VVAESGEDERRDPRGNEMPDQEETR